MQHQIAEEGTAKGDYSTLEEHKTEGEDASKKPKKSFLRARCMYGVFMLLGFVFALVTRNQYIQWIDKWMIEHDSGCTGELCIGNQAAYRVSFSLFLFFMVHWILSSRCNLCMTSEQKVSFNSGNFFWKLIAFIPVLIIAFIIPNPFFVVYAWLTVFGSLLFLMAQLIILLDFSYNWSEKWAAQEERRFQAGLVIAAVLLYGVALTVVGLLYHWFAADASCSTSIGLITVTLLCAVVCTFASVVAQRGSIIPAGVVFLYTVWTCYSSLSSGVPPGLCNSLAPSSISQIIIAAVFTAISLVYTCISAGGSRDSFQLSAEDDAEQKNELDQEAKNFAFFHGIMMLGACYLAMLVTGWTISGTGSTGMANIDSGSTPMWVKFGSEIVCVALYLWTLVAPTCCGDNRNFA